MKTLDIRQLLAANRLPVAPEHHKHVRPGWVQTICPFCSGNPGYHLGFSLDRGSFHCWRCGPHSIASVLRALVPGTSLHVLWEEYGIQRAGTPEPLWVAAPEVKFPTGTRDMTPRHHAYLEGRNFEPERLEREWGLKGTGPVGSYKWRIIIPIYFRGTMVSYTSRDITGRATTPYKACPQQGEVLRHKRTLYGMDRASSRAVIVVEGPADVWRLGPGAVALFGTRFSSAQVNLLKDFGRRFIFFDSGEVEAAHQAKELASLLSIFPGVTEVLDLGEEMDPAQLTPREALAVRKEFLR